MEGGTTTGGVIVGGAITGGAITGGATIGGAGMGGTGTGGPPWAAATPAIASVNPARVTSCFIFIAVSFQGYVEF